MTIVNGFELLHEQQIPELNTVARLYRHVKTGAELLSLENDDENKVFGITFRTPPGDSTGVAHIMEHSVLCGSRKYPVKEPFVELMKGSLNTFLNAMTYPDKTCYPVASQNLQDFYNLIDVYMDAVFYPLLSPYTLDQEGWHFELDDPHKPMTFKGVVYNEMKGVYSQPDNVLDEQVQHSLYPANTYHYDSGGNPAVIPDLTYDEFKNFHDLYYHPSNARIFFYGDDDPQQRLLLMDEYLQAYERIPVQSQVAYQPIFEAPKRLILPYAIGDDQPDAKDFVTVNWLLPEGDPELTFGLIILEQILIGTPAAELRKVLIDSGLGEDLTGRGLETGMLQMFFSTGLKGVKKENVDTVENLILETLTRLSHEGLDPDNIAAAVNTIEFRLRENNTGSYPRGLLLMLRSLETWLYDKDPLALLAFEEPLNAVKARLEAGEPYFEHLIEAYLVNNTHRTSVVLTPDPTLTEERDAAERERLQNARAQMNESDLQAIAENTRTLKRRQEAPDSVEMLKTIPMLTREDLDREIRHFPIEVIDQGKILFHDLFTNGILYMDLGFDMHVMPQEWLPYIPLFGRALLETGTEKESFVQLVQRIGRTTGGIRPTTLTSEVKDKGRSAAWFFLRGKAMVNQTGDLLNILNDVLTGARLDNQERFRQMALDEKASLESRLINMGHVIVNSRLKSHFTEADWATEQMGGVSYLFFLRDLIQKIDQEWGAVSQTLQAIRERLITKQNVLCNITVDATSWQELRPQVEAFLKGLPERKTQRNDWQLPQQPWTEGLTIPAQVNYVGKGANLYQLGYELDGSAYVISNHLRGTWLWDKVRVQGGAYGGFCTFDSQSGVLTFLSYRDPNLLQTLEVYDGAAQYLQNLDLTDSELTKAIIGTIGDMDSYLLPDAKGFTAMRYYLIDLTNEERQQRRDQVLSTTLANFHQFGRVLEELNQNGAVVVLGSADVIEAAEVVKNIQKVL